MANSIISQTILDGTKNLVIKIHIHGDGTGDETDTVVVDASTFSPAFTTCNLMGIHTQFIGFTGELIWDGATDVHLLSIPDYEFNLNGPQIGWFGGVPNNATTPTGDILITTAGLGAGDHGSIILELKKNQ